MKPIRPTGGDDRRTRKARLLDELATARRLGHLRPAGGGAPASPAPAAPSGAPPYDRSSPAALAGSIRARRPR